MRRGVLVLLVATISGSWMTPAFGQVAEAGVAPASGKSRSSHWLEIGLIAGALGGSFAFDHLTHEELSVEPRGRSNVSRVANHFAEPLYVGPVLGGLYGLGYLTDEPALSRTAWHALVGLAATTVVEGGLKIAVGRQRPNAGSDTDEFHPGSFDNAWQSYPSGHTSAAFSLATTFAEESDDPLVSVLSYGGAGIVGWARIRDDRHWLSDVVAGAVVGTVTTHMTLRWLRRAEQASETAPTWRVSPTSVALTIPFR